MIRDKRQRTKASCETLSFSFRKDNVSPGTFAYLLIGQKCVTWSSLAARGRQKRRELGVGAEQLSLISETG